ncbi:MAG: peptidylprolyl isomerase [bacterium]|nr:peptidylprolyl isomerase [bacterium]
MRPVRNALSALFVFALFVACLVPAAGAAPAAKAPQFLRLETEAGNILLVFYPGLAPNHVANFKHLARTGFLDGTRFHRIVPGFVIQGGDPNSKDDDPRNDGLGGPTVRDVLTEAEYQAVVAASKVLEGKGYNALTGEARLKAEFSRTAKHVRGTLSMARSQSVDSAGSQFFICVADTPALDTQYTVFGHVVSGMEVADKIVSAEKNPAAGRDAPAVPVQIIKATVLEGTTGLSAAERGAWDALPASLKDVH